MTSFTNVANPDTCYLIHTHTHVPRLLPLQRGLGYAALLVQFCDAPTAYSLVLGSRSSQLLQPHPLAQPLRRASGLLETDEEVGWGFGRRAPGRRPLT